MLENDQSATAAADGDAATPALPFLLLGPAERPADSAEESEDAVVHPSKPDSAELSAQQTRKPKGTPPDMARRPDNAGAAIARVPGAHVRATYGLFGTALDGMTLSRTTPAVEMLGAGALEAASMAVVRAAAAVEAAAATVLTVANAVDLAAAAIRPAGSASVLAVHEPALADDQPHAFEPAPSRAEPEGRTAATQAASPQLISRRLGGLVTADDPRARFRRVAIIHYWLVTMRGGERVLERLLRLFPGADIFTHVYDPSAMSDTIRAHAVRTSFIQKLPGARRYYQAYLPLMPMALEQLDLRGYDLVISSESGPAKGVITPPDALHLSYVHSPMRYLWDHYHDYRADAGWLKRAAMPLLCHHLRQWDTSSAARVDHILANSNFIRERIAKAWRRDATVVHPPVDASLFAKSDVIDPGYLWVGQLVPYKRADLAIDAFNQMGLPLTVVGDGPQSAALKRLAGPTIRMIPRLAFDELRRAYARCRALVFTAEEDFGIIPVEVMASGRPVIAYGRGGALDSVVAERTGLFFSEQTPDALIEAVRHMEAWLPHFDPETAQARARDFAPERFDCGILEALACA